MNLKLRNPYATPVLPVMPTQTEYPSSTPDYPFAPSMLTSSAPSPNDYGYPDPDGTVASIYSASDQNPSSSSTITAIPVAHLEISTPSQGAIIAISVICGLLLIALLFLLLVFVAKRHERERLTLDIGGGGGGGHHHRRRHRSDKSYTGSGSDDRWRGLGMGGERGPTGPSFIRVTFDGTRNMRMQQGYGIDPRMQNFERPGHREHQQTDRVEEVEDAEELSEVSTMQAGGTRTSRSESETDSHRHS
jgi:hypothetical protein